MSSGFFPVCASEDFGKPLMAAKAAIESVIAKWQDSTYCLNGEDQASDQSYIEKLGDAISNIQYCLQLDESNLREVEAERDRVRREIEALESKEERLGAILAKHKAKAILDGALPPAT